MLKKLLKFPIAIREGFRWQKALTLAAKRENKRVLAVLEKMNRKGRLFFEIDLLKAQILNEEKRHQECVMLSRSLLSKISELDKYDEETKKYFSAYLKWLDFANSGAVGFASLVSDKNELAETVNAVRLDRIQDHWKTNYPLRIHPNWKEVTS